MSDEFDEGKAGKSLPIKVSGAEVQVMGNPDFGWVQVNLAPGQSIFVEGGAMSTMKGDMDVKSRLMGGFFRALIRKLFGGESMFVGEYSHTSGGWLTVSPSVPGRVVHRPMKGETIYLQAGSFLACTPGVTLRTQFGGLRSLFGGEGLFFLLVSGDGDLFFNAHGDVVEKEVTSPFVVDTGHVVGWESTLTWKVRGMGGLKSTLFSGEGLVVEFTGRGKVWVQSRTVKGLAGWVTGYLRG